MIVFLDRLVLTREIRIEEGVDNWVLNPDRLRDPTKNEIGGNVRNSMTTKKVFPMWRGNWE